MRDAGAAGSPRTRLRQARRSGSSSASMITGTVHKSSRAITSTPPQEGEPLGPDPHRPLASSPRSRRLPAPRGPACPSINAKAMTAPARIGGSGRRLQAGEAPRRTERCRSVRQKTAPARSARAGPPVHSRAPRSCSAPQIGRAQAKQHQHAPPGCGNQVVERERRSLISSASRPRPATTRGRFSAATREASSGSSINLRFDQREGRIGFPLRDRREQAAAKRSVAARALRPLPCSAQRG